MDMYIEKSVIRKAMISKSMCVLQAESTMKTKMALNEQWNEPTRIHTRELCAHKNMWAAAHEEDKKKVTAANMARLYTWIYIERCVFVCLCMKQQLS